MKKYKLVIITTFRKYIEVEADNLESAIEETCDNYLDCALDTDDFTTDVEEDY